MDLSVLLQLLAPNGALPEGGLIPGGVQPMPAPAQIPQAMPPMKDQSQIPAAQPVRAPTISGPRGRPPLPVIPPPEDPTMIEPASVTPPPNPQPSAAESLESELMGYGTTEPLIDPIDINPIGGPPQTAQPSKLQNLARAVSNVKAPTAPEAPRVSAPGQYNGPNAQGIDPRLLQLLVPPKPEENRRGLSALLGR